MAYKRYKRTGYGRKTTKRAKMSKRMGRDDSAYAGRASPAASRANYGLTNFTGARGGELKYHDTVVLNGDFLNEGQVIFACGSGQPGVPATPGAVEQYALAIPTNASAIGRIGRAISLKSLSIRGKLFNEGCTNVFNGCILARVIIGVDRQHNSEVAPLVVSNILDNATWTAEPRLSNEQRYHIISDQTFELQTYANLAGTFPTRAVNFHREIPLDFITEYAALDANIIVTNDLFVLVICDNQQEGTPSAKYQLQARVRYADEC